MASAPTVFLQEPRFKWINMHSPPQNLFPHNHVKIRKNLKKLSITCLFTDVNDRRISKIGFGGKLEIKQNPIEILAEAVGNMLKALRKPAAAAVVVGFLLMYVPNSALAASGGRMGGRSFSSSSSRSSQSYSTSWSGSGSGSGSGLGSGFSFSAPYYEPSPVDECVIVAIAVLLVLVYVMLSYGSQSTSVLKLQVGLLGSGRSIQKDLNRIAESADTSTPEGLNYVLTETVLALLRHPDYCFSGYSAVDVKRSMEQGEKIFNQLSIQERAKFDEETLVNVDNIKRQSPTTIRRASGFSNGYIVITILVAAEGDHKLPPINNSKDLKDALQMLASIPSSTTVAVEVLWTPQNEDDTLSEPQMLEDYPLLRPL